MNIFLDTANLKDIQHGIDLGCVSGVTTNPSIIAREKRPYEQCIKEIVRLDENLTILVEVKSNETQQMIDEAKHFSTLGKRIVIKIPMTAAGIPAIPSLSAQGITNCVTLVFSPNQAIVASCTGADYVAPFVGRFDDIGHDGVELVSSIKDIFRAQQADTKVIAASIRNPQSVSSLFRVGCDIVTMPFKVLESMMSHPLTDKGLKKFNEDLQKIPVIQ